jgi:hypothetical protein
MSTITVFNAITGISSTVESNDAEQSHGVDADGLSVGMVPLGSAVHTPPPPDGPGWSWDFTAKVWVFTPTLPDAILEACAAIDSCAGATRLRYITDVPGQQATYLVKTSEASAFLAGAEPGAYLRAEAEATGMTLGEAALAVLQIGSYWNDFIGPAIEKARRMGKIAVEAAATLEEVAQARHDAFTTLGSL